MRFVLHSASQPVALNCYGQWLDALQIFTLFVVHAYSTRIWKQQEAYNSELSVAAIEHGFQSPKGHSKLIMDGPYTLLWPCMLIWPWFQAAISFGWIHNALGNAFASATQVCS